MKRLYQIIGKRNRKESVRFLVKNAQALLPMVELIEESRMAVDELIDVVGRAQIEAVLRLSAERVTGPPHPGRKGGAIGWHGRERGTVCLRERRLRVERPRLRRKGQGKDGEVAHYRHRGNGSETRRAKGSASSVSVGQDLVKREVRGGGSNPHWDEFPQRWRHYLGSGSGLDKAARRSLKAATIKIPSHRSVAIMGGSVQATG